MSSTGQAIGMVVGAAIGFFTGGVGYLALGASIGGMVGSAIDPPKGPDIIGPRLDDLSVQTSTFGAPLARAYGTVSVVGNLFWLEGDALRETTKEEEQGGKGGGGQSVTSYKYSATFAVGLLHVPDGSTVSLRRLWVDTDLIYESGSDNTESFLGSMERVVSTAVNMALTKGEWESGGYISGGPGFTFYPGSDEQLPNARMQADKGAANVSAYPGMCYIVLNDLDLEKYSNTLMRAQVKCELVISGDVTPQYDLIGTTSNTTLNRVATAAVGPTATQYLVIRHTALDNNITSAAIYEYRYGESDGVLTEIDIALSIGYGYTAPQMAACQQCAPGEIVAFAPISYYLSGPTRQALVKITAAGYEIGPQYYDSDGIWKYGSNYIFVSDGATSFAASHDDTVKVIKFSGVDIVASSSVDVKASGIGYSANFVYVVNSTSSSSISCVIEKFTRDLVFVETLTLAVKGTDGILQMLGDDAFYIKAGATISIYDGLSAYTLETTAPISSNPEYSWFAWGGVSQSAGITMTKGVPVPYDINLFHSVVNATPAKLRDIVTAECSLSGVASADLDLDELTNSDVRGYKITARSSVRAALEPLQAAFPFDVATSGYKVRFVSRGGASVATIPSDDLGATDGDQFPVLLPVSREMESQLPYRVSVRYADAGRDYDIGEQYAERPAESLSERTVELAIVMTADEAARTADVLLEKEWVERVDLGPFVLPPTWGELEAADVVTIDHRGQQHEARLTRVQYLRDGRLECSAKKTSAASYVSTARGSDPLTTGQALVPLKGSTLGYLLDIPRIRSEQDVTGMSYGMTGLASGWPGGVLLRSDDAGNSYQSIGAMSSRAKIFTAGSPLSAHHGYSIDNGSALTVTPVYSAHTLVSVTEDQLYAHTNLAAYGADGRWEILSFKTVTDNTGSYAVNDFLRGLYGTEQYTETHATGDYFIFLDTATVSFFGLPTNAIQSGRLYRSVTQGASIDSASDVAYSYIGVNIKPLPPVDLYARRQPDPNDYTLGIQRRTRWPVEVFSGATVPVAETSEAYEFDICNSDYSAVLRTLTTDSSREVVYTEAQQLADFGIAQQTAYVKVYQLSSVVGRGQVMQNSITVLGGGDPFWDLVTLLMHMEGTNGGTTFTDQRGNTFTATNATTSTSQFKFGASSALFSGTAYVTTPAAASLHFGSGEFTVEAFIRPTSLSSNGKIAGIWSDTSTAGFCWRLYVTTAGALQFTYSTNGSNSTTITGTAGVVLVNVWTHVAVCRSGNTIYFFAGGAAAGSSAMSATLFNIAATKLFEIGRDGAGPAAYFVGNIDEVRVTKGAARYSGSTYSVPTSAFSDS